MPETSDELFFHGKQKIERITWRNAKDYFARDLTTHYDKVVLVWCTQCT